MMNKIKIAVVGMHCRSCEMLIEDKLNQIPEVTKSAAKFKRGFVEIFYGGQKPNNKEIEEAIRSAGYSIGKESKKGLFSRNPSDYKDLGIALLFLLGIYLVLKSFGLTNINLAGASSAPTSFFVILLVGLTAGVSTCMAIVGGLVLSISARHSEKHPEASVAQKFKPHVYFNLGRVLGFAFLGGLLGALGSVFQFSSSALGIITILVGIVMLVMGLQLIEIFPIADSLKITLPKFISRGLRIKKQENEYSHVGSFILGALTFFLPCGFTQAMQLFAVSMGSFLGGALVMGTFALGTIPGLLGIGSITSIVKGIFAKRFFKFAGLLVIFFAFFNIANGFNLTGWQIGATNANTASSVSNGSNVTLESGVQIVRMTQSESGYSPNQYTVKKGVPVRWIINSTAPYSCASSIVMQKMNISKKLAAGENTLEFTPTETGALKFSCSMGMYTGVFNVVDKNGAGASATDLQRATEINGGTCNMSDGGCSCGNNSSPSNKIK